MTLEEQCRLSFYKEIAGLGTHDNVKLVQHVETNRIYVKKVQDVYNKEVYALLMKLHDQHVPEIVECMEDEGQLIVIEEYIQGESLAEHITHQGVYSEQEAVAIFITLCDVLNLFHHFQPPVISRDLKPENIIISNQGVLKIVDFNTAKRVIPGKERDTVLIGTREYAAPEQYGFAQSDMRTDIYALGVMLNFMLTGKYPREMLYQPEERKSGKDVEKSIKLTAIIQKCTAFSPDMRYQNVLELKRDLESTTQKHSEMHPIKQKKRSLWHHEALPPGFRTGTIWKMIMAGMGYIFIFWMGLTIDYTTGESHIPLTGYALWVNRICVLVCMLFVLMLICNYRPIVSHLPLMQHRWLRMVMGCVYAFIALIVTVLILQLFLM